MKAVILNSGLGHRMGVVTREHPKCMTEISHKNTILSRQLRQIADAGIKEVLCLDIDGVIVAVALVNSAWGGDSQTVSNRLLTGTHQIIDGHRPLQNVQ